jgi:hypothetical protein
VCDPERPVFAAAGRIAEAIAKDEQIQAVRERVLGTDHPGTSVTRNDLANVGVLRPESAVFGPVASDPCGVPAGRRRARR